MQVYLYDKETELNLLFQSPTDNIPFLNSTIGAFTREGLTRQSAIHKEEVKISMGLGEYPEEYEILLLVPLSSVLVGDIPKEDIAFLQQRPDKFFSNNGVIGGFINKNNPPGEPEENEDLFREFWPITVTNFLGANQALVERLSIRGAAVGEGITTYGNPVILSDDIHNSTICGPCFIGRGVSIRESYIGPGSIITGSASITNGRVLSSFVAGGYFSGEMEDTLSIFSRVDNFSLGKGTKLPYGTVLTK